MTTDPTPPSTPSIGFVYLPIEFVDELPPLRNQPASRDRSRELDAIAVLLTENPERWGKLPPGRSTAQNSVDALKVALERRLPRSSVEVARRQGQIYVRYTPIRYLED